MSTKLVSSLREAIERSGLKSGMSVSFHHHLRNGDYVLNMVMDEIAKMGVGDLTLNASSLFDCHLPLAEHIRNGVVRRIRTDYMSAGLGRMISEGLMAEPVEFRTHGGRPKDIASGETPIDVAFIAAPTADEMGNCTGKLGPSACGSLGYAFPDAMYARNVVVITDNLVPYPLQGWSIPEIYVNTVVRVDAIGNPQGIVSGTTKITRDPVGLVMAERAVEVIRHSGLLKDGFSFQTGAGGASLAAAKFLMDVQCFDLKAVESIRTNPAHQEISAMHYASPGAASAVVDSLDVVILGATEIDTDFNVNVHTDSRGAIMGGSGGHSDTAAGAKLSMIIAPLFRARLPIVTERVRCISTPGRDVDVLVTQRGVAVNPRRAELAERLKAAGLPIVDIHELKEIAERITGAPAPVPSGDQVVARVIHRDGNVIDAIHNVI